MQKRAALYARVSTADQSCEPQLRDLREYVAARGWRAEEYVDVGVSGARQRRPALDRLLAAPSVRRLPLADAYTLGGPAAQPVLGAPLTSRVRSACGRTSRAYDDGEMLSSRAAWRTESCRRMTLASRAGST